MSSVFRIEIAFWSATALAGCNASLVQLSGGAMVSSAVAPDAKRESLLYLSDVAENDVSVYSYPQATFVGKLTSLGRPRSECADTAGNVWIADVQADQVVEYAHGAPRPVAALSTFGAPRGCSVDPKSGDLAVSGGVDGTVLSVFHKSKHGVWRDPRRYNDASIGAAYFCGYDATGNLFIDGTSDARGGSFRLAELPHGANALRNLMVSQRISAPGQVQWDGKYVAVGDEGVSPFVVYRFSVRDGKATASGSTTLDGTASVRQFWIQSSTLIGPGRSNASFWDYPKGGSPSKAIGSIDGYGVAVSLP